MSVLEQFEPKEVFHYFEEICAIAHGSGNVKQISNYLTAFAREKGLEYYQDSLYNVIIIKEASAGYEKEEPIILQGHMDMVAVKKEDCTIDIKKEGLRLYVDGDDIAAEGTSLGGDDGIAVAYALAVLENDSLKHPRLEVILTVDEEVGMEGASAIDLTMLKGHRMLNLDSEDEGIFLTGCAGGARVKCHLPVERKQRKGTCYELRIGGLLGGHSGCEIEKERGNANCLLGRFLTEALAKEKLFLAELSGGLADNAIPREAVMTLIAESEAKETLEKAAAEYETALKKEYAVKDSGIYVTLREKETGIFQALSAESTKKAAALLYLQPNGVQAMSADIEGLVQTSLNLGIARLSAEELLLDTSVRSSLKSEKDNLLMKLKALAELVGAKTEVSGEYPAWEYRQDSPFREKLLAVYRKMYGKEAVVEAIHAGLECGILAEKIKDLDCVSLGPDMKNIHTTEERLSISSVKRVWEYVIEVLGTK